jgi:hypothetical protein
MGRLIEFVAETVETFGAVGLCTVVGGIALAVVIKSVYDK